MKELPPVYNPHGLEEKWYPMWENNKYFSWKNKFPDHKSWDADKIRKMKNDGKVYSIVIPPPNVTGSLHLGHALNHTIQDLLIRYHRMKGDITLWVPGTDHAGIATQNVVEKLLAKEGKKRWEMSREEFEKRVWEWKAQSGGRITHQQRQLGESVDWDYERFTLDEGLSSIVKKVFVSLYNEKLIYRGERIINWCPHDKTALSNIEVEYKEQKGHLYYIRYPLVNPESGDPEYLTIATTRPETMLGDEALAVHPDDERYQGLEGKTVRIPLIDKIIPIIQDSYVDTSFGTGVVKITPAHDPNDFEIGKRHNLPVTRIMDDEAKINEKGFQYVGLSREEARKKILEELEKSGFLEKTEEIKHGVGHCYRCDTAVEPIVSLQWFVDIKPLARKAIDAVREGQIKFIPSRWENTYFEWMENIQDWCISRQLWWGHRIPAFHCNDCGHVMVTEEENPLACEKCGSKNIRRDEDVLDTWFSSGLWPFSTLIQDSTGEKWEDNNPDLGLFYPTSVLVTGFDIIFFWVARMIMFGLHFQKEIPFKDVFIHGLVRDAERKKMSKSRGNVVDPLEKMQEYGTDAFRFFMMSIMPEGKDIVYDESRLKGYSAFANKIWNTARFIWMNQSEDYKIREKQYSLNEIDLWILSHFNTMLDNVQEAIGQYRFGDYARETYDFTWKYLCDHYIELAKLSLAEEKEKNIPEEESSTLHILNFIFLSMLKVLHPVMPFITEELHSYWYPDESIMNASWPEKQYLDMDFTSAIHVDLLLEIIYRTRNMKGELGISPKEKITLHIYTVEEELIFLEKFQNSLMKLSGADKIIWSREAIQKTGYKITLKNGFVVADIAHLVDLEKIKNKLDKEFQNKKSYLEKINAKLNNPDFATHAPEELLNAERQKAEQAEKEIQEIRNVLDSL